MKKNPASKSGFFTPRFFLALVLCSAGASLGILGFAASTLSGKTSNAPQPPSILKPVVGMSVANGISPAARDLPPAQISIHREFETGLPRVKPNQPVPSAFVDPVVQTVPGALAAPTPIANFEGQSANDSGCGCIPPDPNGAVGPTQYVQMVNSTFSVYSKTGTRLLGPKQINSLFSGLIGTNCAARNDGDPVVVYDRIADRWLLSQFTAGGPTTFDECVAVSTSPDATGQYFVYDFQVNNSGIFNDYPHFGLWPDAYYMSTHRFQGNTYVGAGAFAFERAKMLTGQPAQQVSFILANGNTSFGGQLPASLDGANLPPPGAPNYFVEVDSATDMPPAAALRIWKFHVDWTNPANSTFGINTQPDSVTPVANFARPNCDYTAYEMGCVPQAGDAFQLDPIGDRLMHRVAYRNFGDHEAIVLNHTVVSDSTTGQMGPRWYEVRDPGGTPTIFQQSTWGPTSQTDLLYRWMSSVAMDASGDIAIGYSTSNQISFPSIAYAGRLAGDPVNTLTQSETQLFAGGGPQHGELFAPQFGRWGDYTALTIDPTDDCTFWYTDEYYAAADAPTGIWHTRIGSFKFPTCVAATPPVLLSVVSRKTHTGVGDFDIDLPQPPATPGIECRTGGPNSDYTLIFTFSTPVRSCGSASTGVAVTGPNPNQCTVNLSRVTDAQYVKVTLNGVVSSTGGVGNNLSGTMGLLLGDTNGDGRVNVGDTNQTKALSSAALDQSTGTFRSDVNLDGRINVGDTNFVKAHSGASLPPPPP